MTEYRELENKDFPEAADLISVTWNYGKYGLNEELQKAHALGYLLHSLAESNHAEVALADGKVAGFLIGRIESEPLREDYKRLKRKAERITFDSLFEPKGDLRHDYLKIFDIQNRKLFEENGREYSGEIVLLLVGPDFKGRGIGKTLVERFKKRLKERGGTNLFLFTDSECDHGFYPNQGFTFRGKRNAECALRNGEILDFYIYDLDLN